MYRFICKSLYNHFRFYNQLTVHNISSLPDGEKPYIIAGNHTSNYDPLVLLASFKDSREISFMAKASLFKNKLMNYVLTKMHAFPVSRGKTDIGAIKAANKILKSNKVLGIFPEGRRNKNFSDLKNGFSIFSIRNNAPVVPVYIHYKKRFLFKKIDVFVLDPIQPPEYNKETLQEDMEKLKNDFRDSILNCISKI